MPPKKTFTPLRIAAIYFITGAIWIYVSIEVLPLLFHDSGSSRIIKGVCFVILSSLLLYWMIRQYQLANQTIENELQDKVNRLEFLRIFHESFREGQDLPTVFQRVYKIFPKYMNVSKVSLLLYDKKTNTLLHDPFVSVPPIAGQPPILSQPVNFSLSGKCFQEGRAVVINDCSKTDIIPKQFVESLNLKSSLAVPIHNKEVVIGVLRIDDTQQYNRFSQSDVELYTMVAEQLGIVLENARLFTERKQAQRKLDLINNAIQSINECVIITDLNNKIIFVNKTFEKIYGFTEEELVNRGIDIVRGSEVSQELTESIIPKTLEEGGWQGELTNKRKDGTVFPVWLSTSVVRDEQGNPIALMGVSSDISDQKRTESALLDSDRFTHEVISNAGEGIVVYDCDLRYVRWNPFMERITGLSAVEVLGEMATDLFPHLQEEGIEQLLRRALAGERVSSGDVHFNISRTRKSGWVMGTYGPLRNSHGEIIGVIGVVHDTTERKQREIEQQSIITLMASLRAAKTPKEMTPVILDHLSEILDTTGVALGMRDPVTGETVIEMAQGVFAKATGTRMPPGKGIIGKVIETGKSTLVDGAHSETRFSRPELFGEIRGCVPLIVQDKTIGSICIGRNKEITSNDLRLLTTIGEIAANALHRATLHEQVQRRLQHISALRAVDMAITASLDLRLILGILLNQVISQLGVDAAAVLLYNSQSQTLEYASAQGFRSKGIEETRLHLGEGLSSQPALERRIVIIPNLAESKRYTRISILKDEEFVAYCGVPLISKGQIQGVLEIFHRSAIYSDTEWMEFLEALGGQAAIAIDNASLFDKLQRSNVELVAAYDRTLEGWSHAMDLRDKETEGHTKRVVELTLRLARTMGIKEERLVQIRRGALLHDIGKMGIPDNILHKPGPLTEEEMVIMRKHPVYAYELLFPISYLRPALDIPYSHHEKWDGSGYPRGLHGETIPLEARIFAVVDVWDALLSDRPYQAAWSKEKAKQYIESCSGTHFDPTVVKVFLKIV